MSTSDGERVAGFALDDSQELDEHHRGFTRMFTLTVGLLAATTLPTNRVLSQLPSEPRVAFRTAAQRIGSVKIRLAEVPIHRALLSKLATPPKGEPITRWVRESVGRPIDIEDFVLFLDDLLEARKLPSTVHLPASRARAHGILLHPQEIFQGRARRYGTHGALPLDNPPKQLGLRPAPDGATAGPRWTARYQQPRTDAGKLRELSRANPRFARAIQSLFDQLVAQGAFAWIESGIRARERGFLIYGSWYLSRISNPAELDAAIAQLDRHEKAWGLDIPIRWSHPDGFQATTEAARAMADTYGVDYATPRGARYSSHYGGRAVDLVAVNLPSVLTLSAPDGDRRTFDLSRPSQPRDLSLTPELIGWIETHFGIKKLRKDYPHWSDRG